MALTLLQAGTGLRFSETMALTCADADVIGETLAVTVGQDISKTHRARTVPILDERIGAYWRQRLDVTAQNNPHHLRLHRQTLAGIETARMPQRQQRGFIPTAVLHRRRDIA